MCSLTLKPVTHLLGTFLSLHLTALGRSQPLLHPNAFPQSPCSSLFSCISGVPATHDKFLPFPALPLPFSLLCAVWFHVPGGTFSFANPSVPCRTSFCGHLIPVAASPQPKPLSPSLSHLHDTPVYSEILFSSFPITLSPTRQRPGLSLLWPQAGTEPSAYICV